jgi:hypothetical protein
MREPYSLARSRFAVMAAGLDRPDAHALVTGYCMHGQAPIRRAVRACIHQNHQSSSIARATGLRCWGTESSRGI